MDILDKIIWAESGGNPNVHKNPHSSASGLGQFIDSTWLSMIKQHRPEIAKGKSDADLIALKSDPELSRQMTAAYLDDNAHLQRKGLPVTDGAEYLAHFAGPQGAVDILKADPSTPAAALLGSAFAKASPKLAGYTAGQLAAWADRRMAAAPTSLAGSPAVPQQDLDVWPAGDADPSVTTGDNMDDWFDRWIKPLMLP